MTLETATRERTITWEDPAPLLADAATLSGLEYMERLAAGEIPPPPIAKLMGFELPEIAEGNVSISCVPQEWHYNPIGMVHGGLAATMLDTVLGISIHTTLAAGEAYTTVDLHVQYLRAMSVDTGRVKATGEVVHRGRKIATAEGRLTDANGKLIATGITTCMIL